MLVKLIINKLITNNIGVYSNNIELYDINRKTYINNIEIIYDILYIEFYQIDTNGCAIYFDSIQEENDIQNFI